MNKKGIIMSAGVIASIIAGLILLIVLSTAVVGTGDIASLEKRSDGCTAKPISVTMSGDLLVEDTAYLGVIAEAKDITVDEVRSKELGNLLNIDGDLLRGFTSQNYKWEVELINTETNNVADKDKGNGLHAGSGEINEETYTIDFKVLDNNCDGVIDDFNAKLVGTVTTDDNEVSSVDKTIQFRKRYTKHS